MKKMKLILLAVVIIAIAGFGFLYFKKGETRQSASQDTARQRDIASIKNFSGNQDAKVEFVETSKSSNGLNVPVSVYYSDADQYEVDTNGKIIEFSSRNLSVGSENVKSTDNTPRYTQQGLEAIARQLIAKNTDVNLDNLTPNHGVKGTSYFFRWEDMTVKTSEGYLYIQVGYSQGGTLIGYINALQW